jgi:hypothetical protein
MEKQESAGDRETGRETEGERDQGEARDTILRVERRGKEKERRWSGSRNTRRVEACVRKRGEKERKERKEIGEGEIEGRKRERGHLSLLVAISEGSQKERKRQGKREAKKRRREEGRVRIRREGKRK